MNSVAEEYKLPIIVSTHPRIQNRINSLESKVKINEFVTFLKPLGFFDYIKLQLNAKCIISDSGTITKEHQFYPSLQL